MNPWAVYELLLDRVSGTDDLSEAVIMGLVWTLCRGGRGTGLAMTPAAAPRTLPWPGTLSGRPLAQLAT